MFGWLRRIFQMNERQLRRWQRTRRRGEINYVLINGVLCYGGITLTLGLSSDIFLFHQTYTSGRIAGLIIRLSITGLFFGWIMWGVNEGNYQSVLKRLHLMDSQANNDGGAKRDDQSE